MTPAEHRAEAVKFLAEADALRPASPGRMDRLAAAQLHATLALSSAPELAPVAKPVVEPVAEAPAPRKSRAKTTNTTTPAAG